MPINSPKVSSTSLNKSDKSQSLHTNRSRSGIKKDKKKFVKIGKDQSQSVDSNAAPAKAPQEMISMMNLN